MSITSKKERPPVTGQKLTSNFIKKLNNFNNELWSGKTPPFPLPMYVPDRQNNTETGLNHLIYTDASLIQHYIPRRESGTTVLTFLDI